MLKKRNDLDIVQLWYINKLSYHYLIIQVSLTMLLNIDDEKEVQIRQNDALYSCNSIRLLDEVTIVHLHKRGKISSLEQR